MLTSSAELTAAIEKAIASRISQRKFDFWFVGKTKFQWQGSTLRIGVPNRFSLEWLQNRFATEIQAAVADLFDETLEIQFFIDPELFRAARSEQQEVPLLPDEVEERSPKKNKTKPEMPEQVQQTLLPDPETVPESASSSTAKINPRSRQKRRWRKLDDFIVGNCNRVAHASVLAVIDNPGIEVNPLVIHGPVGTGKTHLLEGTYVSLRQSRSDWKVLFISAEDFTNRFVQAMRFGKQDAFRRQFRDCDVLLLDDLNFLAKKKATQEEFLHTFDALHMNGGQIILTCDCHPRLNEEMLPELVDRLVGGGVWGMTPPDWQTRQDLLAHKAKSQKMAFPIDVTAFLAEQLRGNVRELEGAVHSILHLARVHNRKIDLELTREALGDLLRHSVRVVQLTDIDQAVRSTLFLEPGALQTRHRAWTFSHPRLLAMALARKHTRAAHSEIGRYFGKFSHTTVVGAEKKLAKWIGDDARIVLGRSEHRVRDVVDRIERQLFQ